MPSIKINGNNFRMGEGITDFSNDRGFSPSSVNITINYKEGLLGARGTALAGGTFANLTPLAIAEKVSAGTGPYIFFADLDEDLRVYTSDGASLTDTTKEDTGRNYRRWISDAIKYEDVIYVSSATDICRDIANATPDYDWWTSTLSESALTDNQFVPHHFLIVNGVLLITNGASIMYFDGTNHGTILTLPDSDQKITSFCIHNGYVYIASSNLQTSQRGKNYLHIWNGYNKENTLEAEKISLPGRVLNMKSVKGELLLFTRDALFGFVGNTAQKKIDINWKGVGAYNYLVTECNDSLYFIDLPSAASSSSKIKCYQDGVFNNFYSEAYLWMIFSYFASANYDELTFLTNAAQKYINHKTKSTDGTFYSNWYEFPANIIPRKLIIEFESAMVSGDVNTIVLTNQLGTTKTLTASYASQGGVKAVEITIGGTFRASSLQLSLNTFDSVVREITLEYDYTKQPIKE